MFPKNTAFVIALASLLPVLASTAQTQHPKMSHSKPSKMVAYDAKDKRFYSVAWAKAHRMHDKGGDILTIVPMSSLPKEAKESKAMHGAKI